VRPRNIILGLVLFARAAAILDVLTWRVARHTDTVASNASVLAHQDIVPFPLPRNIAGVEDGTSILVEGSQQR
jgi:hypothetical protein